MATFSLHQKASTVLRKSLCWSSSGKDGNRRSPETAHFPHHTIVLQNISTKDDNKIKVSFDNANANPFHQSNTSRFCFYCQLNNGDIFSPPKSLHGSTKKLMLEQQWKRWKPHISRNCALSSPYYCLTKHQYKR